jgi:hypothetical protein
MRNSGNEPRSGRSAGRTLTIPLQPIYVHEALDLGIECGEFPEESKRMSARLRNATWTDDP